MIENPLILIQYWFRSWLGGKRLGCRDPKGTTAAITGAYIILITANSLNCPQICPLSCLVADLQRSAIYPTQKNILQSECWVHVYVYSLGYIIKRPYWNKYTFFLIYHGLIKADRSTNIGRRQSPAQAVCPLYREESWALKSVRLKWLPISAGNIPWQM